MNKKRICICLALVVSVCCLICLIATVRVAAAAVQSGAEVPYGVVMLTLVTALCAAMIWKGCREMD